MRVVEPGHVEASNTEQRPCPHCERVVDVGEAIIVSLRDPDTRWLPASCYAQVWAEELASTETSPSGDYSDADEPHDPDDVENLVALGDGAVIAHDEWLSQIAEWVEAVEQEGRTQAASE